MTHFLCFVFAAHTYIVTYHPGDESLAARAMAAMRGCSKRPISHAANKQPAAMAACQSTAVFCRLSHSLNSSVAREVSLMNRAQRIRIQ